MDCSSENIPEVEIAFGAHANVTLIVLLTNSAEHCLKSYNYLLSAAGMRKKWLEFFGQNSYTNEIHAIVMTSRHWDNIAKCSCPPATPRLRRTIFGTNNQVL